LSWGEEAQEKGVPRGVRTRGARGSTRVDSSQYVYRSKRESRETIHKSLRQGSATKKKDFLWLGPHLKMEKGSPGGGQRIGRRDSSFFPGDRGWLRRQMGAALWKKNY